MALPVQIDDVDDERALLSRVAEEAAGCGGDVGLALRLARSLGPIAPLPGAGSTLGLWNVLATLAAADVTVARVVEPHLDALAILAQAPSVPSERLGVDSESTWGVFAAEAPGLRLAANPVDGGWVLDGTKPWCSLAGSLSHALVTAHTGEHTRRLFAVSLADPGVATRDGAWHASGLAAVPSGPVDFDRVQAVPVGDDGWYLDRPGFAWGGIGVAACWWGGSVGVARRALEAATQRDPDQIALMHLGRLDVALHGARLALAAAAREIDTGEAGRAHAAILADRTRSIVATAAEEVLERVGHALGPGPLALEAEHARRVADLQLYLRQHHAERDDVGLGRRILAGGAPQW